MILEKHIHCSWDGGQTSPTLTKSNAGGQQRMPDKDNFNAVIALDTGEEGDFEKFFRRDEKENV